MERTPPTQMVWGALWLGNEATFSTTEENSQPKNGLVKGPSLGLATHCH